MHVCLRLLFEKDLGWHVLNLDEGGDSVIRIRLRFLLLLLLRLCVLLLVALVLLSLTELDGGRLCQLL